MSFLFGKKQTPAQMLRKHKRALTKATRDMDRERVKLETQEKKLINDIRASAKAGQMDATKIMAKDLVRTRNYVKKFMMMKAQLQAVGLKIQTLQSNQAMAEAMKGVTTAMKKMNKQMNLPAIQKTMMEFEKESEIMNMKEEMVGDAIDDVMGEEDDDVESENIVNSVLEEIGIDMSQQLGGALGPLPTGASAAADSQQPQLVADGMGDDADLQARLDNLRRND